MTIDPAPGSEEIAAILVALERYTVPTAPAVAKAAPSRWRMAGRNFAHDLPEKPRR